MTAVAERLAAAWEGSVTQIHYVPEYYTFDYNGFVADQGIEEVAEGLHDDVRHSSIMMLVDPTTVRMEERMRASNFSINGVELAPLETTLELARGLVDAQAEETVEAIRSRIASGN